MDLGNPRAVCKTRKYKFRKKLKYFISTPNKIMWKMHFFAMLLQFQLESVWIGDDMWKLHEESKSPEILLPLIFQGQLVEHQKIKNYLSEVAFAYLCQTTYPPSIDRCWIPSNAMLTKELQELLYTFGRHSIHEHCFNWIWIIWRLLTHFHHC